MTTNSANLFSIMDKATSSFQGAYSQLYAEGKISLASCKNWFRLLTEELDKTEDPNRKKKIREELFIERGRCKVYKEAIDDYYANNTLGKVLGWFEGVCENLFGWETTAKKAAEILERFDDKILQGVTSDSELADRQAKFRRVGLVSGGPPVKRELDKQIIKDLSKKLCIMLARYENATNKKARLWSIGQEEKLVIKQNGQCYLTSENIGKGANKVVYSGQCHHLFQLYPSLPYAIETYPPCKSKKKAERFLQREIEPLEEFQNVEGIKQVHDSVIAINNDGTFSPIIISEKHNNTLERHLNKNKLNEEQKITLMMSLTNSVVQVHDKGKIHRDINDRNILVDEITGNTVLIDFETCIDVNNNKRKEKIAGSPSNLAPEYAQAVLKCKEETIAWNGWVSRETLNGQINATTQAMDIWQLGLVLFKTYYGEDILTTINGFPILNRKPLSKEDPAPITFISKLTQDKIDAVFQNKTNGPIAQIIKNMLTIDPNLRKLPSSDEWPKTRPEVTGDDALLV